MPVKSRILIVDDDEGIQQYLGEVLAAAGYHTDIAQDGDEAIAFVGTCPVPLVILDLFMPKRGGFQAITAIRQRCPAAKVLAISGGGQFPLGDALLVAARIGAHGTLKKPFTPAQLLAEVERLLSNQPAASSLLVTLDD